MSYNITNTSTGETTSFDGRGVSFVSDNFSASAAAQTKTIHLTTMANQYLDSRKTCRATVYDGVHIHADLTENLTGKLVAESVSGGTETVLVDFDAITNEDELADTAVTDATAAVTSTTTARDAAVAAQGASTVTDLVAASATAKTAWDTAVAATTTAAAADPTVADAKAALDAANADVTDKVAAIGTAQTAQTDAIAALAQALVDAQAALDAAIDAAQEDVSAETTARDDAQAAKDAGPTAENQAVLDAIAARNADQATAATKAQEHTAAQALFLVTAHDARNAEFNAHSAYNAAKAASDSAVASAGALVTAKEAAKVAAEAQLAVAQAAKAEVDARQASRGADLPRRVNMTVGEDHYLKIKDITGGYGVITDVKLVFSITPVRDRSTEIATVTKLREMSEFYASKSITKTEIIRIAVKPDNWVHPNGYVVVGFGDVQFHHGYCPSNLTLSYSDGTSQVVDFGGSDSRRYWRTDGDSFAYEKKVRVKPMLDFTISATPNLPTVTSDFAWHAAMNFDKIKIDVFTGTDVKAGATDLTTGEGSNSTASTPLNEDNYNQLRSSESTAFRMLAVDVADSTDWSTIDNGATADVTEDFLNAGLATYLGITVEALLLGKTDSSETWQKGTDANSGGLPFRSPGFSFPGELFTSLSGLQGGDMPLGDFGGYTWFLNGITFENLNLSPFQIPAIVDPAMPTMDGEITVMSSEYDKAERTLTFDVKSSLSKEYTTYVGIYAYSTVKRTLVRADNGNKDLSPDINYGESHHLISEARAEETMDSDVALRMSAIPGAFVAGNKVILPSKDLEMGFMKGGVQQYASVAIASGLNGAYPAGQAIVIPGIDSQGEPTITNHTLDLSSMATLDVDLVAIIDGKWIWSGGDINIGLSELVGPGGFIRENIDDNLIFFTDRDSESTQLEHDGTIYPNEPYYNPIIVEEQVSPFGVSAIVGNPSLANRQSDQKILHNDVYECTTDPSNLIHSWVNDAAPTNFPMTPNTPGEISGTFDGTDYYLNHRVPFGNFWQYQPCCPGPNAHEKVDTVVVPFADLTPGKVYCHVISYGIFPTLTSATPGTLDGDSGNPLSLPSSRMQFFRCPSPADGAGDKNLKIKIAMTNQGAGQSRPDLFPFWRTGLIASAENAFNALCKLFPSVIYHESESTYDESNGDAVVVFSCPDAKDTILTHGQVYNGTSAWYLEAYTNAVGKKMQGTWTVDQQVVPEEDQPAPNHILRCFVSGDNRSKDCSYTDQSDPDAIWQDTATYARRIRSALTILNDKGFSNIEVRKSARDAETSTRKLFVEQYDIALYCASQATVDDLVGTNLWYERKRSDWEKFNWSSLSGVGNNEDDGETEVFVHSVVPYTAGELPAIYGAPGDLRRWSLEFSDAVAVDVPALDAVKAGERYNGHDMFLIQELNKSGLVDVGFDHGSYWVNDAGNLAPRIECSATVAAMQSALDNFAFNNPKLVTSGYLRIANAINITEMKRYKFQLAGGHYVNKGMWDAVVAAAEAPAFDPNFLAGEHPVWGFEGMKSTFESGFKRLGFSGISLNAGSSVPNTPLYKLSAEFNATPQSVAAANSSTIFFGNQYRTAGLVDSTDRFMRTKMFESDEFAIVEVAGVDVTNFTAAGNLTPSPGTLLGDAILSTFSSTAGDCVTIQGALIKTDGVLARDPNTDSLVCYLPLGTPDNTTGLSTVYISPERMQELDMGDVEGFSVAQDGQVLAGGEPVYVVSDDVTGVGQLLDLTGTSGTSFALIGPTGAILSPDTQVFKITMHEAYGDGWKAGAAGGPRAGIAPSLTIKDHTGETVWEAPQDVMMGADLNINNVTSTDYPQSIVLTAFLPGGSYTIQGISDNFAYEHTYSVSVNGIEVVPETLAGNFDQASLDFDDKQQYYNASYGRLGVDGVSQVVPFDTPPFYTLSTWDKWTPLYQRMAWTDIAGTASFRISDEENNTIFELASDSDLLMGSNENRAAGTEERTTTFQAAPGTYTVVATALDDEDYYYIVSDKIWAVWKGRDLDRVQMFGAGAGDETPVGPLLQGHGNAAEGARTIGLN